MCVYPEEVVMATPTQRSQLLAVTCPHCRAGVGEVCTAAGRHRKVDSEGGQRRSERLPITTLDGGCHDARWQAAGLGTAPVLTKVVQELHAHAAVAAPAPRGVKVAAGERPW